MSELTSVWLSVNHWINEKQKGDLVQKETGQNCRE